MDGPHIMDGSEQTDLRDWFLGRAAAIEGAKCGACGGSGHYAEPDKFGEPVSKGPCPSCEGTGWQHNHNNDPVDCLRCGGSGTDTKGESK